MRLTNHNARTGKSGVFSARHNDRNFDISKADHINPDKCSENVYWHLYQSENPEMTFREAEMRFYQEHFSQALNSQNQRYMAQRHRDKCRTMDDIYRSPQTCPEEAIFMIGNKDSAVTPEQLLEVYRDYSAERKKNFPNIIVLDYALHADEAGGIHIHERFAWTAHNRDREEIPSQSKALTEMGISRPHPDRPKSRYNNAKMTYSQFCREFALSACRSHGIDIETEPQEASKTGLSLLEYKRQREQEQTKTAKRERLQAQYEGDIMHLQNQQALHEFEQDMETRLEIAAEQLHDMQTDYAEQSIRLEQAQKQVQQVNAALKELTSIKKKMARILSIAELREMQTLRNQTEEIQTEYNKNMREDEPEIDDEPEVDDDWGR